MGFSSTGSALRLGDGAGVGCIISFANNLICSLYFFTSSSCVQRELSSIDLFNIESESSDSDRLLCPCLYTRISTLSSHLRLPHFPANKPIQIGTSLLLSQLSPNPLPSKSSVKSSQLRRRVYCE